MKRLVSILLSIFIFSGLLVLPATAATKYNKTYTLSPGQTKFIGLYTNGKTVKWKSSKKATVAVSSSENVSSNAKLTAKKMGSAVITATYGKKKIKYLIKVKKATSLQTGQTTKTVKELLGKPYLSQKANNITYNYYGTYKKFTLVLFSKNHSFSIFSNRKLKYTTDIWKDCNKKTYAWSMGTAFPVSDAKVNEALIFELTNAYRATYKKSPLVKNSTLSKVALAHAKDMEKNNYFDHNSQDGTTPFERMKKAGYSYNMAGENIARYYDNGIVIVEAWVNSEGHQENIIADYTEVGVAWYSNYSVQDFGTPSVPDITNETNETNETQIFE